MPAFSFIEVERKLRQTNERKSTERLVSPQSENFMILRIMTATDYNAVWDLWQTTPGMGLNSIDDSRNGITRYLQRNPDTCFVMTDGESLAGVILAGHDGRRGFIYHTAVAPSYRRRGVGRQLVSAALSALEKHGIIKAACVVFSSNAEGNSFWEATGFPARTDLVYRNKQIIFPESPSACPPKQT
jgi:ribosomal protein S18 acetylase RimI-like enzyme